MERRFDPRTSLFGIVGAILVGTVIALAGAHRGVTSGGLGVMVICAIIAAAVNWVAFVPSYIARTEHFYDLIGSITYLTVTVVALLLTGDIGFRQAVLAAMVVVWAARLGSFLFLRVRAAGGDRRFDRSKHDPLRFLMMWTLQALWVIVTMGAALSAITSGDDSSMEPIAWVGVAVWLIGLGIEVAADRQKNDFRADSANDGRFITTGLWAWSRHPNYFGEIVLWLGVALVALPTMEGWRWLTLVSPVWVYLQLARISGLPMLERSAERRWGDDPDYQRYRDATPVLWPRPPR